MDEKRFPRGKGVQAGLRFCVRYAVLAPSSHNTQPWRFRVGLHHADVMADRRHALPVADPDDRELTISCGAAIYHLGLAAECFGMRTESSILPDASSPDLLARVRVVEGRPEPDPERATMLRAIPRRHTHRGPFEDRDPPPGLIQRFRDLASSLGAGAHLVVGEHDRLALAELIAEADTVQLSDRRFRRELASWLHHNRTHSRDGIPGHALGMHELESIAAPLIVRTFDIGHGRAARDEQIALHSPVLLVIDTPEDTPGDWVAAGRALGAILLKATAAGLGASYLNQPIEVSELRPRIGQIVPDVRCPQLVLRMGYARPAHRTPRRAVDDVCEWTADDPDDDS